MKNLISIGIFIFCLITLVCTKKAAAYILPKCDSLHLIHCNMENEEYAYPYTGSEVTPQIDRIVFGTDEQKTVVKYKEDFNIVSYKKNIDIGTADIEVSVNGYNGTIILQDVFRIQPDLVGNLRMTTSEEGLIELQWDEVKGADGYLLYRSDDGVNYVEIKDVATGDALVHQDTDIALNSTYTYKVCSYAMLNNVRVNGFMSDTVHYNSPLARPVIKTVQNITYNALQVQWNVVDGAVGYKVYRSFSEGGEYVCVAEISSGTNTSFLDATCESAVYNYYYVTACQNVDGKEIWGSPSDIKSGRTTPNRVTLSTEGTETSVNLNWKEPTGAHGYEIYRSVNNGTYELVERYENADQLTWTEEGLNKHTSYTYRIRAFCVMNGQTIYGPYSKTYEKEAVIIFDYSGETGMDILRQYVGRPYVYGGQSPTKGWDCSYFVKWTFATHFNVELPRTAAQQSGYGVSVNVNDRTSWEPGDLIFYRDRNGKGPVAHVAVYLGNGQMIHALSKKRGTLIQSVDEYETWDENKLYCVKRIFSEKSE